LGLDLASKAVRTLIPDDLCVHAEMGSISGRGGTEHYQAPK